MKVNEKIEKLILEANLMPNKLFEQIANCEEANIEAFIDKVQTLVYLVGKLPDKQIMLYYDQIQQYCEIITSLTIKLKERQKKLRKEIFLLNKKVNAQKAYLV